MSGPEKRVQKEVPSENTVFDPFLQVWPKSLYNQALLQKPGNGQNDVLRNPLFGGPFSALLRHGKHHFSGPRRNTHCFRQKEGPKVAKTVKNGLFKSSEIPFRFFWHFEKTRQKLLRNDPKWPEMTTFRPFLASFLLVLLRISDQGARKRDLEQAEKYQKVVFSTLKKGQKVVFSGFVKTDILIKSGLQIGTESLFSTFYTFLKTVPEIGHILKKKCVFSLFWKI